MGATDPASPACQCHSDAGCGAQEGPAVARSDLCTSEQVWPPSYMQPATVHKRAGVEPAAASAGAGSDKDHQESAKRSGWTPVDPQSLRGGLGLAALKVEPPNVGRVPGSQGQAQIWAVFF